MSDTTNPGTGEGTFSWAAVVVLVVFAVLAIGVPIIFGSYSEGRRLERIENAEERYDATYLRSSRDGEGGGLWRFPNGDTVSCQIDGKTSDPELRCAPDMTEPPESDVS